MFANTLNSKYISRLQAEPSWPEESGAFAAAIAEHAVFYKGRAVLNPYHIAIYNEAELRIFRKVVQVVHSLYACVLEAYLRDKEIRKLFAFDARLENLICLADVSEASLPIMRLDVLCNDDGFTVCEINTDGSSAMSECYTAATILKTSNLYKALNKEICLHFADPAAPLAETLIANYERSSLKRERFDKKRVGQANYDLLIVDYFEQKSERSEFAWLQNYFGNYFAEVAVADVRDLVYKDKRLYYKDKVFDLVYRRAVTVDVMKHFEASGALLDAYRDKAVCLQGNFATQLLHNKKLFALIHDSRLSAYIPPALRNELRTYLPATYLLSNLSPALLNDVMRRPEAYVIKNCDSYAGRDVYLGIDYIKNPSAWHSLLAALAGNGDNYIVQNYIAVNSEAYCILERSNFETLCCQAAGKFTCNLGSEDGGSELQLEKHNEDNASFFSKEQCYGVLGLFAYNGEFVAPYLRIGKKLPVTGGINDFTVAMAEAKNF